MPGDAAEMVLDGLVCEGCGEYLDEDAPGHPRRCAGCGGFPSSSRPSQRRQAHRLRGPAHTLDEKLRAKIKPFGELVQHDPFHWQVKQGRVTLADYWPHKGKWRIDGETRVGNDASFLRALSRKANEGTVTTVSAGPGGAGRVEFRGASIAVANGYVARVIARCIDENIPDAEWAAEVLNKYGHLVRHPTERT